MNKLSLPFSTSDQLQAQCQQANRWIRFSRRAGDTWLITTGHILKPPFTVNCQVQNNTAQITITGSNDSIKFTCNKIVVSPFRSNQISFFTIIDDVAVSKRTIAGLSKSYQEMLNAFSLGETVDSDTLYSRIVRDDGTEARHARRRWQELEQDYGFDVGSNPSNSTYWMGESETPIKDPELRPNDKKIGQAYWGELADSSKTFHNDTLPHCSYCDARVISKEEETDQEFESVGLLDHRRPFAQAGDDSIDNLQIFCQTCNNRKNSVCRKCPYGFKCDSCIWAYPEKVRDRRIILHLDPETTTCLRAIVGGKNLEDVVTELIEDYITKDKE
jgi:hypothetical protein